ncbi:hypothetical protein GOODEAATRI_012098 [Goodea atripinnis]|uniref:Major facilitator superfamily (MFS) profile domain-containing protein n=1 Tax=Goodea atripinnis TaxID=208336 RepID=A0ABV0NMY2_9TELE
MGGKIKQHITLNIGKEKQDSHSKTNLHTALWPDRYLILFFFSRYKYETSMSHNTQVNSTENSLPCLSNHSLTGKDEIPDIAAIQACEQAVGSSMWIYVFLGNMLRGIGETPSMPLGISYLDDFSRQENTPFYLACIYTTGMLGPMIGFMLGSYLAKTYVDIGFVDLGMRFLSVRIKKI